MLKKNKIIALGLILGCLFCVPVQGKVLGDEQYRPCVNDIFTGTEQVKKIITEVQSDGTFKALDLGEWLRQQDIYTITSVEKEGDYEKFLYSRNIENEQTEKYYDTDTTSYIFFDTLVKEGDTILEHPDMFETVVSVDEEGNFYTEVVYGGMEEALQEEAE